ncbi:MAG: hypothetical protein ACFE78_06290 [Candidatus Hodarchaeota archaeon]
MVDKHSQSFFGQSTGLTVLSSSRSNPYLYFKCIQKKENGSWEKSSTGEGKTIKCNLDEIIMILKVLKKKEQAWSSFHNFKDSKTQISFKWDEKNDKRLMIRIGKYSKVLNYSQVELLRLLLKHIVKEKIKYATGYKKVPREILKSVHENQVITPKSKGITIGSSEVHEGKTSQIVGSIKNSTEKALLINFNNDLEVWIPRSTIKSTYNIEDDSNQTFLIDEWILKKNNLYN